MIRFFYAALLLFTIQSLHSQICGTDQLPLVDRLESNKRFLNYHQRGAIKYIPVTFHLVANAAGVGRVHESAVLAQLCNLNEQFRDQDAIFYIDSLNYFDNDAVYETPASTAAEIQMNLRRDNNAVNIFITNKADSGNEGPGLTLAYYDPQRDWIVSRKDQITASGKTLAHELGHYFSLMHTHYGWECNPYTVADYGNPVTKIYTLPCPSGGGAVLIELVDSSNCATAADKICDTPADYNFGILYDPGCDENNTIRDK